MIPVQPQSAGTQSMTSTRIKLALIAGFLIRSLLGKLSKWFFYLYYPTHLLLLGMLQAVL